MPAKIKKGDKVVVIAGKDRGKRGTVRQVITKHSRVIVEGVNIIKKHQRARQAGQASQIVEREAPIHISNVMLIDPNTDQPTRVTFRRREDGTLVRVGKRSGEDIE
ncbi:MAG: 50S ribosomal protein L24 [Tepidiforma sp.]|uniref:50S ribosomal protein L24 n=1 Tax=Tepidiforma sp. TaxID=2682230 RepID=UPI0021DE3F9A|nr:50S ribosomal protein L24 [Tepidiforma sp.]MCX7618704.1 50S ribosomal protein L24 [Tepidiforma sp.]GIW19367.1 MAG: 50S ribosomal protein L24 [Tepidiforma sp.]